MIPIGLNLTSIGVTSAWWIESAQAVEKAGFAGVWCWDHHISRGKKSDPVLECWTTLTAAAAHTSRIKVGSFVTNVMNRQPAILARMLATIWDQSGGRVELGIGVGGSSGETEAYGISFPEPTERALILEEAVSVLRLLWSGGPANYDGRVPAPEGSVVAPRSRAAAADHHRRRETCGCPTGGPGRRRLDDQRGRLRDASSDPPRRAVGARPFPRTGRPPGSGVSFRATSHWTASR